MTKLPDGFSVTRGFQSQIRFLAIEGSTTWWNNLSFYTSLEYDLDNPSQNYMGERSSTLKTLQAAVEGVTLCQFNAIALIRYPNGAGGQKWHADHEQVPIATLSFGCSRPFSIRSLITGKQWRTTLNHGDLLVMTGRSQIDFEHGVLPTRPKIGPRVGVSFRNLPSKYAER